LSVTCDNCLRFLSARRPARNDAMVDPGLALGLVV
jgi:hypothetical protein